MNGSNHNTKEEDSQLQLSDSVSHIQHVTVASIWRQMRTDVQRGFIIPPHTHTHNQNEHEKNNKNENEKWRND